MTLEQYIDNLDKRYRLGNATEHMFRCALQQLLESLVPTELYIAGRATTKAKGKIIPVEEIAITTAKHWLSKNIRFLNIEKHIRIIPKIRAGSNDLAELFQRFGKGEIPLANDTSFGVGYYPYSAIEKNVLDIEILLNNRNTKEIFPFIGEDIKVMGVQNTQKTQFTISIAMIDKFISSTEDYRKKINSIKEFINTQFGFIDTEIKINTAHNYKTESIYFTVTGTSAEGGDDGQVGRGNLVNGLITPYHPMSLEASAGKNPVSHIEKIYNHFAFDLSRAIVENRFAEEATVFIVSQIGKPITQPQLLNIKLEHSDVDERQIDRLATEKLDELPLYWKKIIHQNK